jgi:hypothetical protein
MTTGLRAMEKCSGGDDRPARGLVLVKASEKMVAGDLARWEPYWTCEVDHHADEAAMQVRAADPDGTVMSMVFSAPLDSGRYALLLGSAL